MSLHVRNTLYTILRMDVRITFFKLIRSMLVCVSCVRGLLEEYPTFGREKETGLLGALDT